MLGVRSWGLGYSEDVGCETWDVGCGMWDVRPEM